LFAFGGGAVSLPALAPRRKTGVIISLVIFKSNLPFDQLQVLSHKLNSYPQPMDPVDNSVDNFFKNFSKKY